MFLPPPLFYGISIVLPTTDRKVCSARFSFKQSHPKESSFACLVTSCHSQPDLLSGGSVSHIWEENHTRKMKNRACSAMECGAQGAEADDAPLSLKVMKSLHIPTTAQRIFFTELVSSGGKQRRSGCTEKRILKKKMIKFVMLCCLNDVMKRWPYQQCTRCPSPASTRTTCLQWSSQP